MAPLIGPIRVCEHCLPSVQPWPSLKRTVSVGAHGRRKRVHRYLGIASVTQTQDAASVSSVAFASQTADRWRASGRGRLPPGPAPLPGGPGALATGSVAVMDRLLSSLALSPEQRHNLQEASGKLLQAIAHSPAGWPAAPLPAGHGPCEQSRGVGAPPVYDLGQTCGQDVAVAAVFLPPLTWHWLSIADLDGWVGRGVVHLLREALIIQRAASDASTSVSDLVGWCMESCSGPAAALAALWGQQQGQSLPPRVRSFYGLMLQRLGHHASAAPGVPAASRRLPPQPASSAGELDCGGDGSAGGGWALAATGAPAAAGHRVVMCGSVTRTAALPTSSRRQALQAPMTDEAAEGSEAEHGSGGGGGGSPRDGGDTQRDGGQAGGVGGGSSGAPRPLAAPDVILVGELPPEAQAELSGALQMGRQGGLPAASGSSHGARTPNGGIGNGNGSRSGGSYDAATDVGDEQGGLGLDVPGGAGVDSGGVNGTSRVGASSLLGALASAERVGPVAPAAVGSRQPVASLLQRPSRGVVAPEADPGEGSEGEGAADAGQGATSSSGPGGGGSGSGSAPRLRYFTQGGVVQHLPYVPMRLVATGRYPLRDTGHAELREGVAVPEFGPLVISNDPRVFPGTEALLTDFSTVQGEKLAIRLEYIIDRSVSNEVALQLFNMSRIVRKRTDNCRMFVNGSPVNVGDHGVVLKPGDEVWFGNSAFSFRVESLPSPPPAVQGALARLVHRIPKQTWSPPPGLDLPDAASAGAAAAAGDPTLAAVQEAAAAAPASPPDVAAAPVAAEGAATASAVDGDVAAVAAEGRGEDGAVGSLPEPDIGSVDMSELSNMSRRDPRRAEALLRRLAAAEPGNAAVWLVWAQMVAQLAARGQGGIGAPAKARALFRAAVEAAQEMQDIPPPPAALQDLARRAGALRNRRRGRSYGTGSDSDVLDPYDEEDAGPGPRRRRHNWLLVQALGNWAKHEWRLRMYGSARHLFRAAVDEAARHPYGVAGGGGAAIMHFWASRELDSLNCRNARIVAAEALRKCPGDVALYVLAAAVEFEAGNLDLAKSYCARAYSLDRTDKQLFMLWPRVEAALGDRLKARLLFERALDAHPLNTKILNLYARFEAEGGSYRAAAELYDRALRIDAFSAVMGVHNRADWAALEADLGNLPLARGLLEGGLQLHPHSPPLLVTLAKVERLEGRYPQALALLRRAHAVAGPFNVAAMSERAQVLRALGEREMAANLSRHLAAVKQLQRMKQQGYWGSEAWRAYVEATRSDEQRATVAAARGRRLELGWTTAVRGTKPPGGGAAGDGRRPTPPEVQQFMQLRQLRNQRAEVRRLAAQHAARVRAEEAAAEAVRLGGGGAGGSLSSGDEEYGDEYEEPPVGVPLLDSVRRPSPGDDEGY